jgi:Na+-driven multidrug efflux pump
MPLIATNILQNLSGTINTIFVGQMMGCRRLQRLRCSSPSYFA